RDIALIFPGKRAADCQRKFPLLPVLLQREQLRILIPIRSSISQALVRKPESADIAQIPVKGFLDLIKYILTAGKDNFLLGRTKRIAAGHTGFQYGKAVIPFPASVYIVSIRRKTVCQPGSIVLFIGPGSVRTFYPLGPVSCRGQNHCQKSAQKDGLSHFHPFTPPPFPW